MSRPDLNSVSAPSMMVGLSAADATAGNGLPVADSVRRCCGWNPAHPIGGADEKCPTVELLHIHLGSYNNSSFKTDVNKYMNIS